jgi:hypothetical protein
VGAQQIIERERRWATPAAVAAVAAALLFLAGIGLQQAANLYSGASDARSLVSFDDHAGTIVAVSIARAAAFALLGGFLLYLLRAAQARNPRVRGTMVGFIFLGPVLFAIAGILQSIALTNAAADFVDLPPEQARTYEQFQRQVKQDSGSIDKVTIYTDRNQLEVQQTDDVFYTVAHFPDNVESDLPGQLDSADPSVDHETDSDTEAQAGDAQAVHTTNDSTALKTAQALALPAILGLIVSMVYVSLQAMRVGLLTRFAGSFGIALGATVIFFPPLLALPAILWAVFLIYSGLLVVGRVPGGRPPAWEAGEAIPWPRPGEGYSSAGAGGDGAIEGKASEVGNGEQPTTGSEPQGTPAKRKRRRRS